MTKKKPQFVLTIRIDEDLDSKFNKQAIHTNTTKANLIREYLELAKYFNIKKNSFQSLNNNDLILIKQNFFSSIIAEINPIKQIDLGTDMADLINDLARIEEKSDDIEYKLDLCERYGLFPKFVDKGNYILIGKKFGPKKFVEAFIWQLITEGKKGDYDKTFIDSEMEGNKKLITKYEEQIQPVKRDASYYSFEFAKLIR
ncbi:MAG TPA: hypothetical protein VGB37_15625, partial [Candidatus Lokiarchaeia archaeon]